MLVRGSSWIGNYFLQLDKVTSQKIWIFFVNKQKHFEVDKQEKKNEEINKTHIKHDTQDTRYHENYTEYDNCYMIQCVKASRNQCFTFERGKVDAS